MLDFKPESKKTDLNAAIEFLTRVVKHPCTAFVLSDFYVRSDFQQVLQIANRKHDVIALQVYDPRAKELPDVGLMNVTDAETGHEMLIDTSSKKLRTAYKANWLERQHTLQTIFTKSNVDNISIATNEDYVKKLMILFAQRS